MGTDLRTPHSLESEKAILGAIILNPELLDEAKSLVRPEDFFIDAHRQIFAAMCTVAAIDQQIDMVTIGEELQRCRMNISPAVVMSLIDGVPHLPTIENYCHIVADKAKLRTIFVVYQQAAARVIEAQSSAEEIIADVEVRLSGMADEPQRSLPEVCRDFLNSLYEARKSDKRTGITFGRLDSLNDVTGGIREAEYIIIAGRSGNGKSALARQIAFANACNGVRVSVFSPEMLATQFVSMMVPLECGVPFYKIRNPIDLNDSELRAVSESTDRIMQLPLTIDDSTGIGISELVARAKMQISKGAQLIIVDYLQLVEAPSESERERVNKVSAGLRNLAKSTKTPVIALSQLSRPDNKNINERPTMFHLKESGNLEQDAYTVLLLHRPMENKVFTGEDEIVIAKQRFGEAGTFIPVKFDGKRVSYSER